MNDYYSDLKLNYRKRWLVSLIKESVIDHPVVVLTGARQVGKSTLLQHEQPFSVWRYISMDDFDALYQSKRDPSSLWSGTNQVVLDEVQKSPQLLEAVKIAVDSGRDKIRFILSGSANLLLMKHISESLAGRAIYYTLFPMTLGELEGHSLSNLLKILLGGKIPEEGEVPFKQSNLFPLMWKGFMPSLIGLEGDAVLRWWEGYVATYLERDLRQLSQIDSLPDFRRIMMALALRCGQMLNQTEVARDTGISQPTVHRYLNLLETTCLVERLAAFAKNRTKRLIKSPKILWIDPGLAAFLAGHYDPVGLETSREAGGIFESLIFLHLRVLSQFLVPQGRLYYWRTVSGQEVDFVLEWGRHLLAFEAKLTTSPRFSDAQTLKLFLKEYPETAAGILIYTGNELRRLDEKIIAIPWSLLAGGQLLDY